MLHVDHTGCEKVFTGSVILMRDLFAVANLLVRYVTVVCSLHSMLCFDIHG